MGVPSLDPPPDDQYGRADCTSGCFAGTYKNRRSLIFIGANDGMLHAIDGRTGYEVWAFIPYNLLPKLRTLVDGQSIEQFDYFVDSSPKIAEVKIDGTWRSLLIVGQGQGGAFYQAFDVSEAGMGVAPELDDQSALDALLAQFDSPNESIQFKWAFPNYASFDPAYTATFAVTDGTPGGTVKLFGDLRQSASDAEKTVGYTWSVPAVGPLEQSRTTNAVIVGSGYFPNIESLIPSRGTNAPRAGNALYLLDADTGLPLGNPSGSTCPVVASGSGSGMGCVSVGDVASNGRKNALQADPTAAGAAESPVVSKAYLGDVDGQYWRFDIMRSGAISAVKMIDTGQPIYNSSALLFAGSLDVYMFFATGSDLLPSNAPGGTGTFKLFGVVDNGAAAGGRQEFALDLAAVSDAGGLTMGERPTATPSVAGDIVFYSTTTESSSTPCSDYSARLYAVTYAGTPAYDGNDDGRTDDNDSPVVHTLAGRAAAPFAADQHLYITTAGAAGARLEAFGDPEGFNNGIGQVSVRILSWREIR
jgi:Tfp pilus tip-associated adhesin PilY1